MKFKIYRLIPALILVFSLMPGSVFAGSVGALGLRVGQQRLVISTDVSYIQRDVTADDAEDEITCHRLIAKVQYGVIDYVDLYGQIGFSDLIFKDAEFESTIDFIYGGGVKITPVVSAAEDIFASIDLQFLYSNPSDHHISAKYYEYHAAAVVAGKWETFYPYGGLRYSNVVIDVEDVREDAKGDVNVGVFLGSEYFVNPNVFFNLEIKIFDVNAIYLGVGYKF